MQKFFHVPKCNLRLILSICLKYYVIITSMNNLYVMAPADNKSSLSANLYLNDECGRWQTPPAFFFTNINEVQCSLTWGQSIVRTRLHHSSYV